MIKIAIATKHQKDELLAPLFLERFGWKLELVEFDTDSLGTFSPEVKRTLTPKQAALAKARIALENSDAEFGLGSEGSIHPHPYLPMVSLDTELLALVSREQNLELVVSHSSTEIVAVNRVLDAGFDLEAFSKVADLPNHALILRSEDLKLVEKGIREPSQLQQLVDRWKQSETRLILESDFRAMSSPSRAKNIKACAKKLLERWGINCPSCNTPGWGIVGYEYGVRCRDCGGLNTDVALAERLGCISCAHQVSCPTLTDGIAASQCQFCNP